MCDIKEQNDKPERNGYRKKCRKRVVIPVILFLVAVIAIGGRIIYVDSHQVPIPVNLHEEDYPEIYAEELRIIFGEDCEIGEKNTTFIEGDVCGCGHVTPTLQYDTWEVTYHDQSGETFTQTIDNRESLESLQYSWLENHLKQYYEKKYLIDYFDEGTFEELRTYCEISIGVSAHSLERNEENDRISYGNHEYTEQLLAAYRDRDTMLRLSELNCEEIYNLYPMITGFRLSIDDRELSGEEKAGCEKTVQDRVLEMIQEIQSETDDTCNLVLEVVSANCYADLYD
ncbi:MAG: hypothetical protein K2J04_01755, partial [Lachnospiraceae bacterium]|nr:hypothetical protein [Lachnospiraceae bacterium]